MFIFEKTDFTQCSSYGDIAQKDCKEERSNVCQSENVVQLFLIYVWLLAPLQRFIEREKIDFNLAAPGEKNNVACGNQI